MKKKSSYNCIFVLSPNSELTKNFKAIIHPLGPLSMTSGIPMDFRKTDVVPTGKMLYGMFENLIGFHFNPVQRKIIVKQLELFYGKQFDLLFQRTNNDKKFFPIIQHILRMELENDEKSLIDGASFFNDLVSSMNERISYSKELKTHFGGSKTLDKDLVVNFKSIKNNFEKFSEKEYQSIANKLPKSYSQPVVRQYVILNQDIVLNCSSTPELYELLKENNKIKKSLFLGNSESLVEVEIQ